MDHLEHTDVVVIGLGPGGEYAAIQDALKDLNGTTGFGSS